jgi:outer membrane biosynthesis protein TonB
MSAGLETTALIVATIVVGIALVLIPTPTHKPPEPERPQVADHQVPPPQQVVAASQPVPQPERTQDEQLETIEETLLHLQEQVTKMERKVEGQ